MTGELFLTLLNRSITAGWLVLAVLVLRLLFRRAPKAFFAALWVLVGIRLLCPFSFESRFSLLRTAEPVPQELFSSGSLFPAGKETLPGDSGILTENVPDVKEPDAPGKTDREQGKPEHREENAVGADGSSAAEQDNNTMRSVSVLAVASAVWLAGMAGMLFYGGISCWRISRRVRESVPLAGNVRLCDRIGSPFILGVFRPRIYLPSAVNEMDRVYVLAHETAHLRRCDHIWKPLGFLLLSVYWFHPLLWLSYLLLCRDIELACDERVVKEMGEESKKSYSTALINCSIPRRMLTACPLAFGEVSVKRRIKSVLNYKKPAFWIVIAAAVAFLGVGIAFCTNPKEKKEYPVEKPDEAGNDRDEGKLTESGKSDNDIIDWKDSALETAMRRATGITDRPVTWGDVKHMTELDLSGDGSRDKISDISALAELTSLTELDLSGNKLTDISALAGLHNLTVLNLSGNKITDVSTLAGLRNLIALNVADNKASDFRKFEPGTLEGFTALASLDLSNNELTDISALPPLENLAVLNLSGNLLTDVEGLATSRFPVLTELDVSRNKLVGGGGLQQLLNLTLLDASQNKLFTTDGISELTNLGVLNLSGNQGLDLKKLSGLTRLISLDLSRNKELELSELPELTELTSLDLSFNWLTDISSLSRLPKLTSLDLSYNKPADLSVLSGLKNLTELHLSGNGMTDTNALSGFTNLTILDLNENELTDIRSLSKLTNLECLLLSHNELADFSSLSDLTNLTELYLMGNGLTDIGFLSGLTGLTELSLCDNRLTDIESLSELKNLTILLLAGNRLTDISALSGLTRLTWLSLSDNEITNVDSLSGLTRLTTLALERNRIEDVSALSGLTHTSKWLDGNDIKVWQK